LDADPLVRPKRFLQMLSGCDYLPSIPGLGLRTAHKLLRKYKTVTKVLQAIRMAGQLKIPLNYLENFRIAELAFLYQRVYDPFEKKLVTLNEPPEVVQWDDSYIGWRVAFFAD
jgi:exonuclease-1